MAERIQIIIDADDQASREISKSKAALDGLKKAAFAMTAALGTAAVVARQVYKEIGRGAELELAEQRLDGLASSIGTTSDALLGKFAKATGSMLSNAEMVASASQIISTGLADNETDVVRLATVVSELGLDMQQVILTFANNSKMRLDSLGLSVSDVDARTKELVATGMTMDEAFDAAVLELLEERLDLVGSATDSTQGDVKRLEAAWADLRDEISKEIAAEADLGELTEDVRELTGAVVGVVGPTADFVRWLDRISNWTPPSLIVRSISAVADVARDMRNVVSDEAEAADRATLAYANYTQGKREVERATRDAAEAARLATLSFGEQERASREAAQQQMWMNEVHKRATERARNQADEVMRLEQMQRNLAPTVRESADRVFEWSEVGQEAIDTADYWRESNEALERQMGGPFLDTLQNGTDETVNFHSEMLQAAAQAGANTDALAILAAATGDYSDAQIEAAIETAAMTTKAQQLGQAVAEGRISAEGAIEAFKNFQAQLQEPYEAEVTADTDDALARIREVKAAADAAAGTRTIRFNVVGGEIQNSGTAIGGIPRNASGTDYFQGGMTWVGERGPELVQLPRGSRIYSNQESRQIVNNYNLTANYANQRQTSVAQDLRTMELLRTHA